MKAGVPSDGFVVIYEMTKFPFPDVAINHLECLCLKDSWLTAFRRSRSLPDLLDQICNFLTSNASQLTNYMCNLKLTLGEAVLQIKCKLKRFWFRQATMKIILKVPGEVFCKKTFSVFHQNTKICVCVLEAWYVSLKTSAAFLDLLPPTTNDQWNNVKPSVGLYHITCAPAHDTNIMGTHSL